MPVNTIFEPLNPPIAMAEKLVVAEYEIAIVISLPSVVASEYDHLPPWPVVRSQKRYI